MERAPMDRAPTDTDPKAPFPTARHRPEVLDLTGALGLGRGPELLSVVGGGGKSSLLFALADALPGRVVLTTTTRIFAAQMSQADDCCTVEDLDWEGRLEHGTTGLLVVGGVDGDRAVGVPPALPARMLARVGVDWVVVEADGSRMRPTKAPAGHEPVIPPDTDLVIAVAGIDALAAPIRDVAHRPELVSAITGLDPGETLSPEGLATLLASPQGGLKDVPPAARTALLINKVESSSERERARQVARCALAYPRVERVAFGALRRGATSAWEVLRR